MAPRIGGRLDDDVWALVEPVTGFRQMMPRDGDLATQRDSLGWTAEFRIPQRR